MRTAPTCPRCRRPLAPSGPSSRAWTCVAHGEVSPLRPARGPCREGLEDVRSAARVPIWVPWPPPPGWLVAGFADTGDDSSGTSAVAVALSGQDPLGGSPADLVLVAEEPGTGLGASFAGLSGPDPGPGFDRSAPDAKVQIDGHPVPMWAVGGENAAFAGEALGNWLWAVLWPSSAGVLMLEDLTLCDLREVDIDLPYGPFSPWLEA
jgi:hypothetical protein